MKKKKQFKTWKGIIGNKHFTLLIYTHTYKCVYDIYVFYTEHQKSHCSAYRSPVYLLFSAKEILSKTSLLMMQNTVQRVNTIHPIAGEDKSIREMSEILPEMESKPKSLKNAVT